MSGLPSLVQRVLAEAGMREARGRAGELAEFLALLLRANERVNLVSRKEADPDHLARRHLRDALEALPHLPPPTGVPLRLLDVGSGGGFPAIPLLLVRPDLEGTLVEATGKKARFLVETAGALGLAARVVNERFPDPALSRVRGGGSFDVFTSRAVARAGDLVRLARPVLASGAIALLWTTEPLVPELQRALPGARVEFRKSPGAERRGLARLERFT